MTPVSTAQQVLAWARSRNLATWFEAETSSTNTIAKSQAITEPKLFLTEKQTSGRGRGGHTWTTPANALLSTWSFPLKHAPQPILSPLIGLALFTAAKRAHEDRPFNLKAPNDLFLADKKIAGLLIENVMIGNEVTTNIGLGFNAGAAPVEVPTATGFENEMNWPVFLDAWISGVRSALEASRNTTLTSDQREQLKDALNLHPLLKERVLNVGELGQIQTPTQLIHWHML